MTAIAVGSIPADTSTSTKRPTLLPRRPLALLLPPSTPSKTHKQAASTPAVDRAPAGPLEARRWSIPPRTAKFMKYRNGRAAQFQGDQPEAAELLASLRTTTMVDGLVIVTLGAAFLLGIVVGSGLQILVRDAQ
jgi:hypothetical protein